MTPRLLPEHVSMPAPEASVSGAPGARPGAEHAPRARSLYRVEAIRAKSEPVEAADPLDVSPPWARATLWLCAAFFAVVMALSFGCKVDQTGHARGVLRVAGGSRALLTATAGTALEVKVRSGDHVEAGDVIVTIDSGPTRAALAETEAAVTLAERQLARLRGQRAAIYRTRRALLEERVRLLVARERSQVAILGRAKARVAATERMQASGVASSLEVTAASDEQSVAERDVTRVREELAEARLQLAGLEGELDAEGDKLEVELQRARDRREALALASRDTTLRAPASGRLETVLVRTGDMLSVGSAVARLVPDGAPAELVAFLPERDRAFVDVGMKARVELDQLPAGEFGHLSATVARVGADIATRAEVREALGDQVKDGEALYRVELTLDPDSGTPRLRGRVRPGSLLGVRMTLRQRRVAAVIFEPLRKFLESQ